MAVPSAHFETRSISNLELIYDMIRQLKHTSAAAAKKAAAVLRAQLKQELENKKLCAYQPHECTQLTLDGYDYCLRHIMEDPKAPFRQCSFVYSTNGKRCHLPAPKGEKKEHVYCIDHAFKSHLTRVRAAAKHQPADSVESLLDTLSHHVTPNTVNAIKSSDEAGSSKSISKTDSKCTNNLDPFNEIDATSINASRSKILDYASDSDSDLDTATYSSVWHDAQADSSDDESVDSEQEDLLKHAGIYTAEEVTLVTRDKLIRLQSLYIEQFKHLQHVLRDRRRKYLAGLRREKDTLTSIHAQPKDNPLEKKMYKKLKALNHYHKKHGIDAIMNKKLTELRTKVTDHSSKPASFTKCIFSEGGVKCGEKTMPVAKYCRKHILYDRNQVLFKRCSKVYADFECHEPILGIFKDAMCKYHTEFPPVRHYGETRTFDDSDLEDSSDTHEHQGFDIMASSSCESKAPCTITSASQIINFSNQFPNSSSYPHILDEAATLNLHLDDLDNATDFGDVTNEIDVTGIDDTLTCDDNLKEPILPVTPEDMLQKEENSPNTEVEQKTEIAQTGKFEQEAITEETVAIDKDLNIAETIEEEIPSAFVETEQPIELIPLQPTDVVPPQPTDVVPPQPTDVVPPQPMDVVPPQPTDVVPPQPTDVVPPQPMDVVPPQPMDVVPPIPKEENLEDQNILPQLGIDPDDDMAGLMMELQKDNLLDSASKNIDTSSL